MSIMNGSNIHDQYKTIENIRFNHDCLGKLIGFKQNQSNGSSESEKENIIRHNLNVVREVQIRNCQECKIENNADNTVSDAWNQKIFYILKIWTCKDDHHREDYVSLGYKPFEYSFKEYIEGITRSINELLKVDKVEGLSKEEREIRHIRRQKEVREKQEEVLSLLQDIVELVNILHSRKIFLRNIDLNNILVCKEDTNFKAKIVNLSQAESIVEDAESNYKIDLINIGKLFLSFITYNDDYESIFGEINRHREYNLKLNSLHEIIQTINWIEPYRKKLLAHLIIYLLEIDECNETTIFDFKSHPFFWDNNNIEEFIRIVSCRIDYHDKLKVKTVMKKRISEINIKIQQYNNWTEEIDSLLKTYIQQDTFKKNEYMCNELIKFIRNKIAHQDDDTDNEDFIPDPSGSSSNSPYRSDSPASKKKKSGKDLKPLFKFFDDRGGPLNYFLFIFPDLLHDLFVYFRRYSRHKKIKPFYPKCFQDELPKVARRSLKSCSHAPIDTKSKNESLIYKERKSRQM